MRSGGVVLGSSCLKMFTIVSQEFSVIQELASNCFIPSTGFIEQASFQS